MLTKQKACQTPIIVVDGLSKTFTNKYKTLKALDNVSLRVMPGEMVALIGASGSGKSTLLRHIAGLSGSHLTDGCVNVLGQDVQKNGVLSKDIRAIRARIGFIFQQFNIVDRLPLLTNVLAGTLGRVAMWRAALRWFTPSEKLSALEAMRRVEIAEFALQRSSTLSGGQQQRAAIARALVQRAEVILADEPIASLDPASSRRVMETLSQINKEDGITVLVSLHQVNYALAYCQRAIALKNGRIVYDGDCSQLMRDTLSEIYGEKFDESGIIEEEPVSINAIVCNRKAANMN